MQNDGSVPVATLDAESRCLQTASTHLFGSVLGFT
jgi:hypothetical protein